MRRLAVVLWYLACAAPVAARPAASEDGVAALLTRVEQVLQAGVPGQYMDLLSATASRTAADEFARVNVVSGVTRAVVRERDRSDLEGSLPGDGYQLLVEVLVESGQQARLSTWRLDVRRRGGEAGGTWGIAGQSVLSTLHGLYRLSLNQQRQITVHDFAMTDEDMRLTVPGGRMFVAEADGEPTALVILGRGEMRFTPEPRTERAQIRLFAGAESLQESFDTVFIRIPPLALETRATGRQERDAAVDPGELRRAEEVFREEAGKSFGIDLGDLSSDRWSLLPTSEDFLAEVRTRRFGTLTYARSGNDIEDISLYDRSKRRNLSVYSSRAHVARYTRFYDDDDRADYAVESYTLDVAMDPPRRWIAGHVRMAIQVHGAAVGALSLRLADPLGVQSVTSPEFGRLLCVRARNQNAVVVNLPGVLRQGQRFTLFVDYAGALNPQTVDREALAPQRHYLDDSADTDVFLEESLLYSNRSHWYPAAPTESYGRGTITVIVPERYTCIASGRLVSSALAPGPVQRGIAMHRFSFLVDQPLRYFAVLVARLGQARSDTVPLEPAGPGPHRDHVDVAVSTSMRLRSNLAPLERMTTNIVRFYTSLIGDCPFPSLTLAAVEQKLPGGHSPGYMAVLGLPLPGTPVRWSEDPAALPGFPEFFVAHELAHQWWGQAVGWKNYHEQWLSEGFAQYFSVLFAERLRGRSVFDADIRFMQHWATEQSAQGPVYLGYRVGHIKANSRAFRAVVYDKGAIVLHMLRRLVGDEAFFSGLRRFYTEWRFRKAGSEDLRRCMEQASGMRLERFFERWIYNEGLPRIAFTWRVEGAPDAPEAVLRFEQAGDVYDLPVTVTFDYADRPPADTVVRLDAQVVETRVRLAGKVRGIDVNKDAASLGTFR